ncbi:hypothetical protein V6N12_007719 [Hibiscus sabdariffa]|uniref:Uncharacterized protein n=1 Tax=Hibiscus sabdariffa TaxID=183260 RepID=A0ABR2F2L8_9ROSI
MSSKVSGFFSSKNSTVFNFNKAHELRQIRKRLDAVAEEKNKFHLTENVRDLETDEDREWRLTSSLVNESEIFGRNEDRENVINGLLARSKWFVHLYHLWYGWTWKDYSCSTGLQ